MTFYKIYKISKQFYKIYENIKTTYNKILRQY